MQATTLEGQILTPEGWVTGRLSCTGSILAVEPAADVAGDRFILPGFVDLHVHGGGGGDCMTGEAAVRTMSRFHARHGTTAMLATTVTAPADDIRTAFRGIAGVVERPEAGASRVLGAHLEGPFISPDALGAQPPFAIPPDLSLLEELAVIAPLRVATMAPEIDPDGTLVAALRQLGCRPQIGHTTCSYAQAKAALQAGVTGFTHLFNAMSGLQHRRPGAVGCALAHGDWAEMIFDLLHVEEGAVLAALRAVPRLYGITDAVAATGMPDGEYRLGRHTTHKQGDAIRLADGTLAGSALTMDRALRNLLHLGLPLEEAARRLSTLPADYLGLQERGRIAPGAAADLVMVDRQGTLLAVLAEGSVIR